MRLYKIRNYFLLKCVIGIIVSGLLVLPVGAQTDEPKYMRVDYIDTRGIIDENDSFLKIEHELWKPIHKERLRQGILLYRGLYHVFAGGPDASYNYVVTTIFDDFGKLDNYRLDEIIANVYPSDDPEEIIKRTKVTRNIVRTEIWQVNGAILPEGATMPGGKYATINFFDARDGSGEHADLEFGFWGRIHELRIDREILNSWAMYTLLYPEGDVRYYTYSTIDYYDELGDLRQPVGMELARIAHPDLTDDELSDYFTRTGEARTVYKTELWKLIDSGSIDDEF